MLFRSGVTSRTRSSGRGPRDFRLEYSADGNNWHHANEPNTISVGNAQALTHGSSLLVSSLPYGANNQDTFYIRWLIISEAGSNNTGNILATGSTTINNIIITGTTAQEIQNRRIENQAFTFSVIFSATDD